jgi:hypothetical protein
MVTWLQHNAKAVDEHPEKLLTLENFHSRFHDKLVAYRDSVTPEEQNGIQSLLCDGMDIYTPKVDNDEIEQIATNVKFASYLDPISSSSHLQHKTEGWYRTLYTPCYGKGFGNGTDTMELPQSPSSSDDRCSSSSPVSRVQPVADMVQRAQEHAERQEAKYRAQLEEVQLRRHHQ